MPYIVTSVTETLGEAVASFDMEIPPGHEADDILLAIVTQDGGGNTISVPGWNQIGTQAAAQAQRTACFWKRATGSSEPDFEATGTADEWVVTIVVIRGCPTSVSPIHQQNRNDSLNSTTAYLDSGSVTTTENNCLLIYAWGFDNVFKLIPQDPNSLIMLGKETDLVGCVQIVGYRPQLTAGATPVIRALSEVASEGGSAWVIALSDANPSAAKMPPFIDQGYTVMKRYGGITTAATTVAAFIRHDSVTWGALSGMGMSTIDGVTVDTTSPSQVAYQDQTTPWGSMTGLSFANSTAGSWVGGTHTFTTTDMRGKIFTLQFQQSAIAAYFGKKGIIVVFRDTSGNWAAFTASLKSAMYPLVNYVVFIDVENATPLDQSANPINWQYISSIGYGYHRRGSTTTASILRIKNFLLLEKVIIVGGCQESPVTPGFLDVALNGWGPILLASGQGKGQMLGKFSVQYGNGSGKTYIDANATSFEFPLKPDNSIRRRFWKVADNSVEVRIKASANDVVNMPACLLATDTPQHFIIDSSSSASATYEFDGLSMVGWKVTHSVSGITIKGATFKQCYLITLNGGALEDSSVVESRVSPALTTNDPGKIKEVLFISAGSGHAIEITSPGTYTFEGNLFQGYGANDTTDAAIYNNSGGAVTLNITGGGDTPTVRNGTGASTTIVNTVTVKVTVKDVNTGSPIENARVLVEADAGGDLSEGTDILTGLTNSSGVVQTTSFNYTNPQPVKGKVRRATPAYGTLYKSSPISGIITSAGLDVTVLLIPDE